MKAEEKKLDNPVWNSLTEIHQNFSIKYQGIKFYNPDYCPFGGFVNFKRAFGGIDQYSALTGNFYVVGDKHDFSNNIKLNKELVCNQMILDTPINFEINESIIELHANHNDDLLNLINLVQPGYFRKNTSQLGSYFGIYCKKELIAVTGERMKWILILKLVL